MAILTNDERLPEAATFQVAVNLKWDDLTRFVAANELRAAA